MLLQIDFKTNIDCQRYFLLKPIRNFVHIVELLFDSLLAFVSMRNR